MSLEQRRRPAEAMASATRASDADRDEVLVRLHTAYAEGRLTDGELDERIDLTLAARTHDELGRLSADLPPSRDASYAQDEAGATARTGRTGGRFQLAYKGHLRRSGRWQVPESHTTVVYKGGCLLDLRSAELDGPVTVLRVLAYKSTVEVIVPPGVRVETGGLGVSCELNGVPSPRAPVVRVQGYGYKAAIEARDHLPVP